MFNTVQMDNESYIFLSSLEAIFKSTHSNIHSTPNHAPDSDDSVAIFLQNLGIGKPYLTKYKKLAEQNGSRLIDELLASGIVTETSLYGAIARHLRLAFTVNINAEIIKADEHTEAQQISAQYIKLHPKNLAPIYVVAPDLINVDALRALLVRDPSIRDKIIISTPSAIKSSVWDAQKRHRCEISTELLWRTKPHYSAKLVLLGKQGFYLGLLTAFIIAGAITATSITFMILHSIISTFFFLAMLFRLLALVKIPCTENTRVLNAANASEPLPTYTVLVAIYKEAPIVNQLIRELKKLDWPKSLLDIKIICEEDDFETLQTLSEKNLGLEFEIVKVPYSLPRTKPKALSYALAGARGDFIAVYDAEDRPHPQQLKAAYYAFKQLPQSVACLQAPLIITNISCSWISASFAMEYAALFRRTLPMLAARKLPLPLGGTSNHFKTNILKQIGGWDPYNVTEDADLGVRLYRRGYQSRTIDYPTYEDAPTNMKVWLHQRSRWYKGWLQTWLIAMRNPIETAKEMGWKSNLSFHLLIGGMLLASLSHPFLLSYLIFITHTFVFEGFASLSTAQKILFSLDTINIIGSYAVFILVARSAMSPIERIKSGASWICTPCYWLLLSLAAWKAVIELKRQPFSWNKTPHEPTQ